MLFFLRRPAVLITIAVVLAAIAGQPATAQGVRGVQHLVDPGDNWADLEQRLRPGDEIVLMPGRHRPGTLANVRGTADRPIIIRGLNPSHPSIIEADRYGIRLLRPEHIVIRDLTIDEPTMLGIEITADSGDRRRPRNDRARWAAHVELRNVHIRKVGPIGRRNAVTLVGLEHVRIDRCRFEGWGGSAIELIACRDVTIERSTFQGLENFSQMSAVQVRAGSEQVQINGNTMIEAGVTAIALGGSSDVEDFRNGATNSTGGAGRSRDDNNRLHEARNVRVTRNVFHGGHSAVAFINCHQCVVRNNTIRRPQRWAYLLLDHQEPHLAPTRQTTFGLNLILWKPDDLERLAHWRSGADHSGLELEQNLWWSPDLQEQRTKLGDPVGTIRHPQIYDVDPQVDENLIPTTRRARIFGADAP